MNLPKYINIIICEYTFDENSCASFLSINQENLEDYKYIYRKFYFCIDNRQIRKLYGVVHIQKLKLYDNLLYLEFCNYFNEKFSKNIFPDSITNLVFGHCFDQEIDEGSLPKYLINLTFGKHFNHEIKANTLPQSLINLKLSCYYTKKIKPNILPKHLINLYVHEMYFYKKEVKLSYPKINIIKYECNSDVVFC
jgi:hypothetical protein